MPSTVRVAVLSAVAAASAGLAAAVVALSPAPARGQATQAATRPVSDARSAVLVVRALADAAGTPAADPAVRQAVAIGEPNDAPRAMREAAAWVTAHREAVEGVGKSPLPATPWGAATARPAADGKPAKIYLLVFEWPASGKVVAYGLPTDAVAKAYLLGSPGKPLAVEPAGHGGSATAPSTAAVPATAPATDPAAAADPALRDAVVEVAAKNAKAPDPIGTVVVLELAGEPTVRSLAVPAGDDGSVRLHARAAVVVGRVLRFEPEPNKNTLGYWTSPADWAYWEFTVARPGTFDVELLQGCGKGSGGSEVDVTVDGERPMAMTVEDTGHFQNFVPRVVGRATLSAGPHRLEVKVRKKAGAAVMDLRQVTLKPAGG